MHPRVRKHLGAVALALTVAVVAAPGQAQEVPNAVRQEVLVRTSLLTFNDANVTGIYTVLHAKLSAPFREQFTADKLKESFKSFADKHIDIDIIAAKPVTPDGPAKLDDKGILALGGKIVVSDKITVRYDFKYIRSEGEWKLLDILVKVD